MEILEFVKTNEVDPVYFESSYYMVPEEAGRRPYALLTKALEESEFVAIAKLTMHNREYNGFRAAQAATDAAHHVLRRGSRARSNRSGAPEVEIKDAEIKVAHEPLKRWRASGIRRNITTLFRTI